MTTVLFAHNPKGGCFDSTPPLTWVGILLTVWLLLTVCHEYGGVVGYDMLALGLSYSRGIKLIHISISLYNLTNLTLTVDNVLIFINRAPGVKGLPWSVSRTGV